MHIYFPFGGWRGVGTFVVVQGLLRYSGQQYVFRIRRFRKNSCSNRSYSTGGGGGGVSAYNKAVDILTAHTQLFVYWWQPRPSIRPPLFLRVGTCHKPVSFVWHLKCTGNPPPTFAAQIKEVTIQHFPVCFTSTFESSGVFLRVFLRVWTVEDQLRTTDAHRRALDGTCRFSFIHRLLAARSV